MCFRCENRFKRKLQAVFVCECVRLKFKARIFTVFLFFQCNFGVRQVIGSRFTKKKSNWMSSPEIENKIENFN